VPACTCQASAPSRILCHPAARVLPIASRSGQSVSCHSERVRSRWNQRDVRPTRDDRVNRIHSSLFNLVGRSLVLHCAAIEFALGRAATGQRLAASRRPLRWPLSGPAIHVRRATPPAESRLVSSLHHAIPPRNNRLWATHGVRVRGGATPSSAGSRAPTPYRCQPLRRRRSPSRIRLTAAAQSSGSTTTADGESAQVEAEVRVFGRSEKGHRGDSVQSRQCPFSHTLRCPQPSAVSPTNPAQLHARSGSAFGSAHEGGATPPAVENVDPTPVDVCPLRDVAPPSQQFVVGERTCATAGVRVSPRRVSPCCASVTALAPTRDRTGVLGRVKVPRAPRAAASTPAATLTPPPRARRKATIGASGTMTVSTIECRLSSSPIAT